MGRRSSYLCLIIKNVHKKTMLSTYFALQIIIHGNLIIKEAKPGKVKKNCCCCCNCVHHLQRESMSGFYKEWRFRLMSFFLFRSFALISGFTIFILVFFVLFAFCGRKLVAFNSILMQQTVTSNNNNFLFIFSNNFALRNVYFYFTIIMIHICFHGPVSRILSSYRKPKTLPWLNFCLVLLICLKSPNKVAHPLCIMMWKRNGR